MCVRKGAIAAESSMREMWVILRAVRALRHVSDALTRYFSTAFQVTRRAAMRIRECTASSVSLLVVDRGSNRYGLRGHPQPSSSPPHRSPHAYVASPSLPVPALRGPAARLFGKALTGATLVLRGCGAVSALRVRGVDKRYERSASVGSAPKPARSAVRITRARAMEMRFDAGAVST